MREYNEQQFLNTFKWAIAADVLATLLFGPIALLELIPNSVKYGQHKAIIQLTKDMDKQNDVISEMKYRVNSFGKLVEVISIVRDKEGNLINMVSSNKGDAK